MSTADQAKSVVRHDVEAFKRGDLDALEARGNDCRGQPGKIKRRWGARDAASQARQLGIA